MFDMFDMIKQGIIHCNENNLIKKNDRSMPKNSHITASLEDIEQAIATITPKIACPSEISVEEEFTLYRNRAKKQHTSITENVVKVCCDYEAIAAILRCRLTQDNSVFEAWGVREIHISFSDRPTEIVYID